LPQNERITWMNIPFRLMDKPLLPAGLQGQVTVVTDY
jgi:hypothetical protein